jgi:hypothetical protein
MCAYIKNVFFITKMGSYFVFTYIFSTPFVHVLNEYLNRPENKRFSQ